LHRKSRESRFKKGGGGRGGGEALNCSSLTLGKTHPPSAFSLCWEVFVAAISELKYDFPPPFITLGARKGGGVEEEREGGAAKGSSILLIVLSKKMYTATIISCTCDAQ
jgi:hypothetical protein